MKNIQKEHFEAEYVESFVARPCHLHDTIFSLMKQTAFSDGDQILDIGAGRGQLLDRITEHCKKMAVDIPLFFDALSFSGKTPPEKRTLT